MHAMHGREPLYGAREITVVTPDSGTDIYAVHQQVWKGVSPWISSQAGQSFLFAPESLAPERRHEGLWRVRSAHLPAQGTTATRLTRTGVLQVVLAATQIRHGLEQPVPEADQLDWASAVLQRHGLQTRDCRVIERWVASGIKRSARHRIRVPAVQLLARFSVHDARLAECAFMNGVGRGRRFGFGMLRVVR